MQTIFSQIGISEIWTGVDIMSTCIGSGKMSRTYSLLKPQRLFTLLGLVR